MKKTKILVVEDEAIIAKALQLRLQHMGYDVPYTTGNGDGCYTAGSNRWN
jgi:DNA-binding response OmpR family regulator